MDIAIVGGGPVGLITAIVLIEDNDNYQIDIYEKRKEYIREQFIVSGGKKGNFLKNLPQQLQKLILEKIMCYIENPVTNKFGFCYKTQNPNYSLHYTIEIKTLEKILNGYIKSNYKQINIINEEFTKKDIDGYNVVIGADGQKSYVREKILKSKWEEISKSYILHIKYTDLSNKKYLLSKEYYAPSIYEQDRFRLIRSNTPKTQFLLQIDENTYNKIKNIKKYKNLPKRIKNIIIINSSIMGSRPIRLSNTLVNVYSNTIGYSEKYRTIVNDKLYVLIGDSAMTTHVFTGEGLNIPFKLFSKAVKHFFDKEYNLVSRTYHMKDRYNKKIHTALRRQLPYKMIEKHCSKIPIGHLLSLFEDDLYIRSLKENIDNIKGVPKSQIKTELCYILRDKIINSKIIYIL